MKNFDNVSFQGKFRNYQQRVLDNSSKYLVNNKIHIVASPGSGKTILGLELIRRLDAPCLVLSPTNTIKFQWGDRFKELFLTSGQNVDDYVSYDLFNVSLITSITYQALHSAIDKVAVIDEEGENIDYSKIDLFKLVREYGVKTICVDEAHHLQNEWQKALDIFIKGLDKNIKIIALTATPPYDASPVEWDRYIKTCGEIDEEIFVPELVKQKNLCPHQDYIYFNYPLLEEGLIIKEFRESVANFHRELKEKNILRNIDDKIIKVYTNSSERLYKNIEEYTNVYYLLKKLGNEFKEKKLKRILKVESSEDVLATSENAINFILSEDGLIDSKQKADIKLLLKKYNLLERGKASLENNPKIDKNLILSMGKIESILKITKSEHENLKDKLRLLVLTDFIRRKDISKIGTSESFADISIVSIFENMRRANPELKIGVVSGSLVVLPTELYDYVSELMGENANKLSLSNLKDSGYSEYIFNISNKEKVALIGKIFEEGKINAIVGTKSLLGEGWDSPCINTLIMASFVGSFMLSNQMRGRAIRVYKHDENKTANIWHLVTLEPNDTKTTDAIVCSEEASSDYKTLKRRFNCFVGPHYETNNIESGIDRISILKKSYTPECVEEINNQMESMAKNRAELPAKWKINNDGLMYVQDVIPAGIIPRKLAILNFIFPTSFLLLMFILTAFILPANVSWIILKLALYFVGYFMILPYLALNIFKIMQLIFGKLYVKHIASAIRTSLIKNGNITKNNSVKVRQDIKKKEIYLHLVSDDIREQKVFLDCVGEFLSPFENPKYIMVKTFLNMKLYKYSFKIPALLSTNRIAIRRVVDRFILLSNSKLIYTPTNKKELFLCMRYNYNKKKLEIKQKQVNM